MGLDTTHGCWHGAYSAFNRFRNKLAVLAGYELEQVSFGGECPLLDWDKYETEAYLYGDPDAEIPDDPLILLFAHSDCDGYLYPKQAQALADRMQELLPLTHEVDGRLHRVENLTIATEQFIEGLRKAVKRNEKVGFH